MKARYAILAVAALLTPALAATTQPDRFANVPELSAQRLTGSLNVGYDSNYVGRGLVISHSVAEGDSSEFVALKLNYDINKENYWSIDSTILYKMVSSGHTLYGPQPYAYYSSIGYNVPKKNIENEFALVTGARYKGKMANLSFGHKFVHGGLLGAMAKHFRNQGASVVNEFFVAPSVSPAPWVDAGITLSYSFNGIQGYWFEPYVTFKLPLIGEPGDVKLAGLLTLGMSATYSYFDESYGACSNGAQAWWIKLSTPYFLTKDFIITPSVSFNWLGNGGQKANKVAKFKGINDQYVPFRNFAVVAGVSCTYVF